MIHNITTKDYCLYCWNKGWAVSFRGQSLPCHLCEKGAKERGQWQAANEAEAAIGLVPCGCSQNTNDRTGFSQSADFGILDQTNK